MKVTFKDVGQGDSIILEWEKDGVTKIGIIDCKKTGRINPVKVHLEKHGYTEIEFIILSHPHSDHYSGLLDLLKFIKANNIRISMFCHTLRDIGKEYWEWFEVSNEETKEIAEIMKLANELKDELSLINEFVYPFDRTSIALTDSILIENHSPSHDEILVYQETVKRDSKTNKKLASKAANYLSTVLQLSVNGKKILLTADAEKSTLNRIHRNNRMRGVFSLCQAPHHGSFVNYDNDFWDNLSTDTTKDAVFSAGIHDQYQHPHIATIRGFVGNGYNVHSTNIVYGMEEFVDELRKKTLILDSDSTVAEEFYTSGDKVFSF